MEKSRFKVALVGFGHVGKKALDALQESPDMEVSCIVELPQVIEDIKKEFINIPIVDDVKKLGKIDVAVLAIGSRLVPKIAPIYLQKGINTVDAYDIRGDSWFKLNEDLDKVAKKYNAVSIISAGWCPGNCSIIKALFEMIAPKGLTYKYVGPGMSMGHTVAVKSIEGVDDAISLTIPKSMGLKMLVNYIKLKKGYNFENVVRAIKKDSYFIDDELHVFSVNNIKNITDMGQSIKIERKGVSGKTHNQRMEYSMSFNNPAATGQILVSTARASLKQKPGCYSILDIPPIDFLYGNKQELLSRLI